MSLFFPSCLVRTGREHRCRLWNDESNVGSNLSAHGIFPLYDSSAAANSLSYKICFHNILSDLRGLIQKYDTSPSLSSFPFYRKLSLADAAITKAWLAVSSAIRSD